MNTERGIQIGVIRSLCCPLAYIPHQDRHIQWNEIGLGTILHGFFRFYSERLNYEKIGITVKAMRNYLYELIDPYYKLGGRWAL